MQTALKQRIRRAAQRGMSQRAIALQEGKARSTISHHLGTPEFRRNLKARLISIGIERFAVEEDAIGLVKFAMKNIAKHPELKNKLNTQDIKNLTWAATKAGDTGRNLLKKFLDDADFDTDPELTRAKLLIEAKKKAAEAGALTVEAAFLGEPPPAEPGP